MHLTKGGSLIPKNARPDKQPVEVVERVVLMSLLAKKRRWPVSELAEWINEERFEEAVASLEEIGLVLCEDDAIVATPAAIRCDELGR
jgi:hypothetical protein